MIKLVLTPSVGEEDTDPLSDALIIHEPTIRGCEQPSDNTDYTLEAVSRKLKYLKCFLNIKSKLEEMKTITITDNIDYKELFLVTSSFNESFKALTAGMETNNECSKPLQVGRPVLHHLMTPVMIIQLTQKVE